MGSPKRGAALGLGTAIQAAILENFRQKIDTHEDLPTEGVVALFRDAWARERDQVTLAEDDDPADLREAGDVIARVYMDQAAPRIEPAAVEKPVTDKIGNAITLAEVAEWDEHGASVLPISESSPFGGGQAAQCAAPNLRKAIKPQPLSTNRHVGVVGPVHNAGSICKQGQSRAVQSRAMGITHL